MTSPDPTPSAASTHHARANASSAASGPTGVPSTATVIATPIASPTWRSMLTTAEPVAKLDGGRSAVAVAMSVGSTSPTPTPVSIIPPRTPAG